MASYQIPLRTHVFDSSHAEQEIEWLENVFVEPENFLSLVGIRSVVTFGAEGSGKTALRLALVNYAVRHTDSMPLFIRWYPTVVEGDPRQIVNAFLNQVLDACAQELLQCICQNPPILINSQDWLREAASWFIQTYYEGDWRFELSKLNASHNAEYIRDLQTLLSAQPRTIIPQNAPPARIIAQMSSVVRNLDKQGVWVFVDGMETLADQDPEGLANTLKALLSTLALFDESGFSIKMMAPKQLETDLLLASSTIRRRWDIYSLEWSTAQLTKIVESRAAFMLGKDVFNIKELYTPKKLQSWLEKYGGNSPRGWLEMIRPLMKFQQARKTIRPLTEDEFNDLCRKYPPRLRIDLNTDKVFLGHGEVNDLQPSAFKLLRYLYLQKNRTSTRQELYYRVYAGLDKVPRSHADDDWVPRKQWEGAIDTAIYRLRQSVEPNPKEPIYIISDAGKSIIRLNHVW